jgi:transcription initiation factor TFIIIB Brf1 subunit/transcription initiation factor TFIIB
MTYYHTGCRDCSGFHFLTDFAAGDVLCANCGLVQEGSILVDDAAHNYSIINEVETMEPGLHIENQETNLKMKSFLHTLNLQDAIQQEAYNIFNEVNRKYKFRGSPLNAAVAASIYIACSSSTQRNRVSRDMREICQRVGIDTSLFSKVLKHIYKLVPDTAHRMRNVSEDDTLMRTIAAIDGMPQDKVWIVARETHLLDNIRKEKQLMMGSPPNIVNAVLIFVACKRLDIRLHKTTFLEQVEISRASLDKYIKLFIKNLAVK